jgi:hypothetical protein
MKQQKSKTEIEQLLLDAVREVAGDYVERVEITRANPALYGANWSATSLGGAATRCGREGAIMKAVTVLQGKYDVDWDAPTVPDTIKEEALPKHRRPDR